MPSELEQFAIQDLRSWGCKCKEPLLGWRPEWGPRCRLCNTENPNRAWKAEAMEVLRPIAAQVTNEPDTLIINTHHKMFRSARRLVEKEDGRG